MTGPIKITVDLDALQQLASRLAHIHDAFANVKDDVSAYGSSLGSARVQHELDSFVSGWKDGRKKVEDNIGKLLDKVRGVAQTYQEQEDALSKQAQPGHR
jgi:uncharacterized protein YukE